MKKVLLFASLLSATAGIARAQDAPAANDELITVYRWYSPIDRNFVTVAENEFQEGQILSWGWRDKTPLFVAYKSPGEGRIGVVSWRNPVTHDFISIAEDEFTDDQMIKQGYTDRKVQFYALVRRGPNTLPVYRWSRGSIDWVTIPEEGNTDAYIKKGYKRKTFQFFGINREVDAPVYNQL